MTLLDRDTIAAIATASGKGGIGVVRVSGGRARDIGENITGKTLLPRQAVFSVFRDSEDAVDEGIALYFAAPASFTGEDVVELHGHGGTQVLNLLLQACIAQGARQARPGEFSERAFLNNKLDLTQAEAIADLIDAGSAQAARNAVHSLQGEFSRAVHALVEQMLQLRMYVEAALDFPEEEIDFLADSTVAAQLTALLSATAAVLQEAQRGAVIRDGLHVVIAGKPNAGKSSLLNALAGRDTAIVTDIAGTTRDVLREHIVIDELPLHIIDTAGLRESDDPVEQEGIRRAWTEIERADLVLLLVDSSETAETDVEKLWRSVSSHARPAVPTLLVQNKIDISGMDATTSAERVSVSAKTGAGLEHLRARLRLQAGLSHAGESRYSARTRHVDALQRAAQLLQTSQTHFLATGAGELLAEDLKLAQQYLGEISGQISNDELLGKIFG
ncbi:MAG: tRNA uridine-5-carboxymethylaminomethyl(34) synthesis GTPase MnmE, partial [Pseudomonadales bacterium]|nr:tRNA uridine-5-carboxymethylaminomethyl(34) synthesis GTPase MnmE [Pseudomonadales bacterium]